MWLKSISSDIKVFYNLVLSLHLQQSLLMVHIYLLKTGLLLNRYKCSNLLSYISEVFKIDIKRELFQNLSAKDLLTNNSSYLPSLSFCLLK